MPHTCVDLFLEVLFPCFVMYAFYSRCILYNYFIHTFDHLVYLQGYTRKHLCVNITYE